MTARDIESALLARCAAVARDVTLTAQDQREANVFRLAAMIMRSRFSAECDNLMRASDQYFALHPDESLASAELVRKGWVITLPRLRDKLSRELTQAPRSE